MLIVATEEFCEMGKVKLQREQQQPVVSTLDRAETERDGCEFVLVGSSGKLRFYLGYSSEYLFDG
jgi:hypothetical protein